VRLAAATTSLALVAACGGLGKDDSPDSAGGSAAVAAGSYQMSSVICLSTGGPPAYPSGAHKAALFAFDDLNEHTFELRASDAVETIRDADCSLTVTRSIFQNAGESFALARDRRHAFTPDGCRLHVTVNGVTTQVGKDTTTLFTDSADTAEELPFEAKRDPASGATVLTTPADPALGELWMRYGCPAGDRIERRLVPAEASTS
jgi:hypothetical protein